MEELFESGGFLTPWIICLVISATILWFYRTRNPVKQFRPRFGELAVIGVILFGLSTGASLVVFKAVTEGQDSLEAMKKAEKLKKLPTSGSTAGGGGGGSVFEETLTGIESTRREEAMGEEREE